MTAERISGEYTLFRLTGFCWVFIPDMVKDRQGPCINVVFGLYAVGGPEFILII
jgi:hypothetical protein